MVALIVYILLVAVFSSAVLLSLDSFQNELTAVRGQNVQLLTESTW